jgi:very-short-patch-repair endonuclease
VQTGKTSAYRDIDYLQFQVVVELDGRLGHEATANRWADMTRDIATAMDGAVTVRLGWLHVEHDACRTATAVSRLLRSRGWPGPPKPCSPSCVVGREGWR